jgi:hypothetical protein
MSPDGASPLTTTGRFGMRIPGLPLIGGALAVIGLTMLLAGGALAFSGRARTLVAGRPAQRGGSGAAYA